MRRRIGEQRTAAAVVVLAAVVGGALVACGNHSESGPVTAERAVPPVESTTIDMIQSEIEVAARKYFDAYNRADIEAMSAVSFGYVLYGIQKKGDSYRDEIADNLGRNGQAIVVGFERLTSAHPERATITVNIRRERTAVIATLRLHMTKIMGNWRINEIEGTT